MTVTEIFALLLITDALKDIFIFSNPNVAALNEVINAENEGLIVLKPNGPKKLYVFAVALLVPLLMIVKV